MVLGSDWIGPDSHILDSLAYSVGTLRVVRDLLLGVTLTGASHHVGYAGFLLVMGPVTFHVCRTTTWRWAFATTGIFN